MPQALPYIFAAVAAAGTASAVASSNRAAKTASTIGNLNSNAQLSYAEANSQAVIKQGDEEASVDQQNASAQIDQARVEAASIRAQNQRTLGTQRTSFLKSGVALSGSAIDVMYDSSVQGELDALNAEYRGNVAYGNLTDQSQLAKSQAATTADLYRRQAASGSAISVYDATSRAAAYRAQATASLLSGAGKIMSGPSFT